MTKKQRFIINAIVLYIASFIFAVILLIQNPMTQVEEKTFFQLGLNGDVRENLVFSLGLRDFYSVRTLIITPEAYNHLEMTPYLIEYFAGIPTFEIRQIDQAVDLSGMNLIEEYILSPEVSLRFFEADSPTLYVFFDDGTIVVWGDLS